jgi:15-cis-phytoene synthase
MSNDLAATITRKSKSSFYYSFNLLPKEQRSAIYTVYAFCKETDDIVDTSGQTTEKEKRLLKWHHELERSLTGESSYQLLNKLSATAHRFKIPIDHFTELIKGVEMDLTTNRYRTFDELYVYCYRVASTVGLMCAEIFSYSHGNTRKYAENLGIALQLTNIIRDVKSDLYRDRIYIPLEDLERFSYTEEDLRNQVYDDRFVSLMRYQAERARHYYAEANRYLALEDRKHFFAARIMEKIYFNVLRKIERKNYNVFGKKMRLNRLHQMAIAVNVWARHKLLST